MIRGAIAFGLVLKIPDEPETFKERGTIITTTLILVIFTTLVFGTFMKFSQRVFLPEHLFKKPTKEVHDAHDDKQLLNNIVQTATTLKI